MNRTRISSLILVYLAILFLSFSACKKESLPTCTDGVKNGNETGVDCGAGSCNACPGARIKTEKYYGAYLPETTTYFYDSEGRVSKISKVGYDVWVLYRSSSRFTYYTDSIQRVDSGSFGIRNSLYTLDSKGYSGPVDADGHALEAGDVWENGNKVSEQVVYDGIGTTTTYTYTYTDKVNTIGNENKGMLFMGKSSKNLQSTVTYFGNSYPVVYEFDSLNRVIKKSNLVSYTYY